LKPPGKRLFAILSWAACGIRSQRLFLLDRPPNFIDEGIDAALRVGHLPDSSMVAARVGEMRQVIDAAPSYLREYPGIEAPGDLSG